MRILIAEDTRTAVLLHRSFKHQSVVADIASDGEQALYLATTADYDAIVLTVSLPKLNGIEVCRKLREKEVKSPIILTSQRGTTEEVVQGLDSGADDYLNKPFRFPELSARLRAAIRRKEILRPPILRVSDVVLDCNKRMVTRGGEVIRLSPKEYRLLECLTRSAGKVLSRYELLENVWGSGDCFLTNVIDVHMSHLREKLNRGFKKALIQSVRGAGYLLE